jgi:hypothetical protein
MARKREWNRSNPIRRYKERHKITYDQLARVLGISPDYAKKLGSDCVGSVSLAKARDFERRTEGEIKFSAVVRWMVGPADESAGAAA